MPESTPDRNAEMLKQGYDENVIRQAPDLEQGQEHPSVVEVQNFLKHYGYLDYASDVLDTAPESGRLDPVTVRALTELRRRYNLKPVDERWVIDHVSRQFMAAPKCGLPDQVATRFVYATNCAWDRRVLFWRIGLRGSSRPSFESLTKDLYDTLPAHSTSLEQDITHARQLAFWAVDRAFSTWAAAGVGLQFRFTWEDAGFQPYYDAQISVEWRQAADPDFKMGSAIGAHSDYPPRCSARPLPKPLHFNDEDFTWADGAYPDRVDIESTALHEIGHLLGLQHSNVTGSVMYPIFSPNATLRSLSADDLAGLRILYPV